MKYRIWRVGRVALMLAAAALLGGVVMVLWNAVVPAVFDGGKAVDYWHALGLLVLSRILFGGFRGRGGWRYRRWRRWERMTPEEREQLRQSFASRFGRREERT